MARPGRRRPVRLIESPDGVRWSVEVALPSNSRAMVIFHHPDGRSARQDRYAWYDVKGPEALNVGARVDPNRVLESISDQGLARLFRRSMLISAADNPLSLPILHSA